MPRALASNRSLYTKRWRLVDEMGKESGKYHAVTLYFWRGLAALSNVQPYAGRDMRYPQYLIAA